MDKRTRTSGAYVAAKRNRALAWGVAVVAVVAVGVFFGLGADRDDSAGPGTRSTGQVRRAAPVGQAAGGQVVGEAARLRAMDPKKLARAVASEAAAAKPGAKKTSAVKQIWRVGEVGTYLVGRGIPQGTYESAPQATGTCRWARLRGLSGKPSDVVEHGSAPSGRASLVILRSTDAFFETNGCQNWHKVG